MSVLRRSVIAILAWAGLAGGLLAGCPQAASAGTGPRSPVTRLAPGPALQRQLLRMYAAYRHIPAADIAGVAAGSARAAEVAGTGAEWASAGFLPSGRAPLTVRVGFQDGGRYGIFTRTPGRPWTLAGLGGEPFGCGTAIPAPVRHAWRLADCAAPAGPPGTRPRPGRAAGGTTAQLASIALGQVGVSDNPPSTDFSFDCDPYTTLVGVDVSSSNCGKTSNEPYFGSTQDRNEEWCADLTKWVWEQAGVTSDLSTLTPAAASFYTWGQQHGESMPLDPSGPKVGDAVVYYPPGDQPNGSYADHVGIVTAVNSNGTVNLVNGDIAGSSNISVEYATDTTPAAWGNAYEADGEGWTFVSPLLPAASPADVASTSPAVYDPASGHMEVYGTVADGPLQETYFTGSKWTGWRSLTGPDVTGVPAAVYDPIDSALEVYALGSGGTLVEYWWTKAGGWQSHTLKGGAIASSPSAVYNKGSGNLEVYAQSSSGALEEYWWNTANGWSSQTLGSAGDVDSTPSAVYDQIDGALEVYARTAKSTLWEDYWHSGNGWHTASLNGSLAAL